MAVQEQVDRLKRSVDEWNQWRRQHPHLQPNLNGADLNGVYLRGVYLNGADLSRADFSDTNLSGAGLSRADLSRTDLSDTNLAGASLSRADLHNAYLCRTYLRDANLSKANLTNANLSKANLTRADLSGANLTSANLVGATLGNINLGEATLDNANLSKANLTNANLSNANLTGANLSGVNFTRADLSGANLTNANLNDANLAGAKLSRTNLDQANLTETRFWDTFFAWIDLSNIKGLDTAIHEGPSTVNINSVILPHNEDTCQHFLRGTGFPDIFIDYLPSLLTTPIQYYSLFISFAHQDKTIAERLHTDLRKHDIPCWFAPHELIPGDYYRHKIDEAINRHDKLVLILSEHSIRSQWVEKEVERALKKEESMDMTRQVLFPIRLDDTVMTTNRRWISSLRYHRHIGDFTGWQDETFYQQAFNTLLRHLTVTKSPTL